MGQSPDEPGELSSDTMNRLFPRRVRCARRQHEVLEELSKKTGKPVDELVWEAIELYLSYQNPR